MASKIKILATTFKDEVTDILNLDSIFKKIERANIVDLDKDDKNYFAIFTRTPFFPKSVLPTITNEMYTLMQEGTLKPLIVMSTEQWDLFEIFRNFEHSPYNKFIQVFKNRGVPEENITWVVPDHNYVEQIKFLKKQGIDVKCKFIQFNHMLELMIPVTKAYHMPEHNITKHFTCLCKGRRRHNRFSMIYELWRNKLLPKGNVSCEAYQNDTQTKGFDWLDDKVTTEQFMSNFDEWSNNANDFKNILPIDFDGKQNKHWNVKEYDESELFESAFVWIACETMHEQDGIFITEKTWKAIAYGKPFLLNGDTGSLAYLKSIGYKTFNDFWDESYDSASDVDRIKIIAGIVKDLCSKDMQEINNMYKRMLPILKHNQKVLRENTQHEDLIKELHNA